MQLSLEHLTETFRKQTHAACAVCGYDAEALLRVGSLERLFCERDLRDALLDAINFNCRVPDTLE